LSATNFLSHMIHRRILPFARCSKLQSPEKVKRKTTLRPKGMLLHPGRVQRSYWSTTANLMKALGISQELSGGSYACTTCPVSNLARIARKTNLLRNIVWLSLVSRFEIRHPIHHIASSVNHKRIFKKKESFTHEYSRRARADIVWERRG